MCPVLHGCTKKKDNYTNYVRVVSTVILSVFPVHTAITQIKPHLPSHGLAQLVEALRYKPEGRGVNLRWCHWYFPLT